MKRTATAAAPQGQLSAAPAPLPCPALPPLAGHPRYRHPDPLHQASDPRPAEPLRWQRRARSAPGNAQPAPPGRGRRPPAPMGARRSAATCSGRWNVNTAPPRPAPATAGGREAPAPPVSGDAFPGPYRHPAAGERRSCQPGIQPAARRPPCGTSRLTHSRPTAAGPVP